MAYFLFTKKILEGKPINIFNHGDMERDFTYIDDIVEGITRVLMQAPNLDLEWSGNSPSPASSSAPWRLYNIGSNRPVKLMDYVREIEKNIGKKAEINFLPLQAGDVVKSHADVDPLVNDFGYAPKYSVKYGIKNFVEWYLDYYHSSKNL
jgi:UDP-glucuronate 4-epimerase